ncbi:hypothetical protein V1509DRAFT_609005 [Lipomyces kononenkoae]
MTLRSMDHLLHCNIFAPSLLPDSPDAFEELIDALYCGKATASLTLVHIQDLMVRFSIPIAKTLEVLYLYHVVNNRLRMFNLNSDDYSAIYDFLVALDYKIVEIDDSLMINFIASLAKLRLLRKISDEISLSFPTTDPYRSKLDQLAKSWTVFYNDSRSKNHENAAGCTKTDLLIDNISPKQLSQIPSNRFPLVRYDFQPDPSYPRTGMELARRITEDRVRKVSASDGVRAETNSHKLQNELNLFQQGEADLECIPHLPNLILTIPHHSAGLYCNLKSMLTSLSSAVVNRYRGYSNIPVHDNAELVEISS